MRSSLPAALCLVLAATASASAACDVAGVRLEDAIAAKPELQAPANAQTVRDLRTLRDAAIVLDAFKYEQDCERLVTIVRTLTADPEKTIEQSGDTDEEKAEAIEETRRPKVSEPRLAEPAHPKRR